MVNCQYNIGIRKFLFSQGYNVLSDMEELTWKSCYADSTKYTVKALIN